MTDPSAAKEPSPETQRSDAVLTALRRVLRAADINSRELAKITGLTTSQLLVLQLLDSGGPSTITGLARHVNLMQATMTTIIDRLEDRGHVVRVRNAEDRRKVNVSITQGGRDVLKRAPQLLQSIFLQNYIRTPEWQQSLVIAALELIADLMNAGALDASPILDVGAVDRIAGRTEPA